MKIVDVISKVVKENPAPVWYVVGVIAGGTTVGIVLNNRIKDCEERLEFSKSVADLQSDITIMACREGKKLCDENLKLKEEISELKKKQGSKS